MGSEKIRDSREGMVDVNWLQNLQSPWRWVSGRACGRSPWLLHLKWEDPPIPQLGYWIMWRGGVESSMYPGLFGCWLWIWFSQLLQAPLSWLCRHDGLYPWIVSQSKPFSTVLVKYFINATGTEAKTETILFYQVNKDIERRKGTKPSLAGEYQYKIWTSHSRN